MRTTIYTLITAVLLLSSAAVCSAQDSSKKAKKNTIELFVPISHFFDVTQTNWLLLVPTGIGSKKTIPASYGLRYTRYLTQKGSLRLSLLSYARVYLYTGDKVPGETVWRFYDLFSIGYIHQLSEGKSLSISVLGEINMRSGSEAFHITYINGNLRHPMVWNFIFKDIGLTAGLRVEQSLPFNFLLSGEVKYTRFVLEFEKGIYVPELERTKKVSPNVLTIDLGLGYRF